MLLTGSSWRHRLSLPDRGCLSFSQNHSNHQLYCCSSLTTYACRYPTATTRVPVMPVQDHILYDNPCAQNSWCRQNHEGNSHPGRLHGRHVRQQSSSAKSHHAGRLCVSCRLLPTPTACGYLATSGAHWPVIDQNRCSLITTLLTTLKRTLWA